MMKTTECQKTTVKQDDPNPVWAEEFQLPVYRPDQELIVQMWDSDLVSLDDEIGQATLAIVDLMSGTLTEVAAEIFVQVNLKHLGRLVYNLVSDHVNARLRAVEFSVFLSQVRISDRCWAPMCQAYCVSDIMTQARTVCSFVHDV